MVIALVAGIWLSILAPSVRAEVLGQTVPTMPPPTHTASPTNPVTPSVTNPGLPSATAPQVTGEAPTQMEAEASATTTAASTNVATGTPPEGRLLTASPSPAVGNSTKATVVVRATEKAEVTPGAMQTASREPVGVGTQVAAETLGGSDRTGLLVGAIIGGLVLVMVVLAVMVVRSGERKR